MMSDVEAAQNARADAFLRRAEQLIRSLSGIADARIHDDGHGGIRAIDVMPRPDNTAARAARNVQSALLAAFGTGVDLDRIRVRPPEDPPRAGWSDDPGGDGALEEEAQEVAAVDEASAHDIELETRDSTPAPEPVAYPKNGNGTGLAEPTPAEVDEPYMDRRAGPRLVSLDIVRHASGSVTCIVAVVVDTEVRRASVEALDLPGAAEHAAAQAVARAIGAGLELEGVRHVEIAGLDYVVVAAREDAHGRKRAAATLVTRSAAHAAADAATRVARTLMPAPMT